MEADIKPRVALATLGCKVNQSETQSITEQFAAMGCKIVDFIEPADIYVINTCSVTAASESKSRQLISRAHRNNPQALIALAGCYAQRDAAGLLSLPGVRLCVGNAGKGGLAAAAVELQKTGDSKDLTGNIHTARCYEELPVSGFEGHSRAYMKIEDGCASYCSYCIIPYLRGPVRSRSMDDILTEAVRLGQKGYRELVLGGIHLTSYGKDLKNGESLAGVLEALQALPEVYRVRLGSLEPAAIDDAFVSRVRGLDKLCPHFHLSLQSGSATVLKRMNRRYTPQQYALVCNRLREAFPGCAISTDIIVGFPGETQAEFEETCAFAQQIQFSSVHVFAYSRRQGTVACDMHGQIEKAVKQAREQQLLAITRASAAGYAKQLVGKDVEALVLSGGQDSTIRGLTRQHVEIQFSGSGLKSGAIVNLRAVSALNGRLRGEFI